MSRRTRLLAWGAIVISLFTSVGWSAVINVNWDGSGDYTTIQAALNAATNNDEIIVAQGTYNENINFGGKDVILRSSAPDNWAVVEATVIQGTSSGSVVTFAGTETADCQLTGFTITGGNSTGCGGAILGGLTGASISNCIVTGNTAVSAGGGIQGIYGDISNCIVQNNSSSAGGGAFAGCFGRIENCLISGNRAVSYGGAFNNCDGDIVNCTVVSNTTSSEGIFRMCDGTVSNCIIWDNTGSLFYDCTAAISYCCYPGGSGSNITLNPEFVDASGGDYRLFSFSPCIDAGTNSPPGGLAATDIDGNTRPVDGDGDTVAVADMGAYEVLWSEPVIWLSASELFFNAYEGEAEPDTQVLVIRNAGAGTLDWTITEDCDWLSVNPVSDSSTGEKDYVSVSVDISGLGVGSYNCELTVSAPGAANTPETVDVTLNVGYLLRVPQQYSTIQAAIEDANDYDIIIVGQGVYQENINFGGKDVIVRSTEPGDWNVVSNTIIDGGSNGSCVTFENGESGQAVLEGFTITGGAGTSVYYEFYHGFINNYYVGGGIYCRDSSPTIRRCNITRNKVPSLSLIYCGGGIALLGDCQARIENCFITENESYFGGGIYIRSNNPSGASTRIESCTVANNSVLYEAMYEEDIRNYEVDCWDTYPVITDTIIYSPDTPSLLIAEPLLVTYCDIREAHLWDEYYPYSYSYDHTTSGGNINQPPKFVSLGTVPDTSEAGGYHLSIDSPCINAGDPAYAYGPDKADIDGDERVLLEVIDIGADEVKPVIRMTKPAGGEIWTQSSSHLIEWRSLGVEYVDIEVSFDGGFMWSDEASHAADTGSYLWQAPEIISSNCVIRVSDSSAADVADSSGIFSIKAYQPDEPTDSVWPMTAANKNRTGTGDLAGPQTGCIESFIDTAGPVMVSMAVGAEGRIHAVCSQGVLQTFDPNGTLLWQYPEGFVDEQAPPVARWRMDETSGTVAHDWQGNYDGGLVNFPSDDSQWVAGHIEGSLKFDGSNDYVQITGYKGITGSAARTCEAWIKTTSTANQDILSWGQYPSTGGKWVLGIYASEFGALVQGGNIFCDGSALLDGQWHHVAVTIEDDCNINQAKLYIDGVKKTISRSTSCLVNTVESEDVRLGVFAPAGLYFTGQIDDVRIYDYAVNYRVPDDIQVTGPPAVGPDGTIYFGDSSGRLNAVDKDGQLRWRHVTGEPVYSAPAVAEDGSIYVGGPDGKVYALAQDGGDIWTFTLPGCGAAGESVLAPPAVGNDGVVYAGGIYTGILYALDTNDGTVLWGCDIKHPVNPGDPSEGTVTGAFVSAPVVGPDGTVYVCPAYDTKLYSINPADGGINWSVDLVSALDGLYSTQLLDDWLGEGKDCWTEPVVTPDGTIYAALDDIFVRAVNPDGSIKWIKQLGMFGGFTMAAGADGLLYVCSQDGSMYVLDSDGDMVSRFSVAGELSYPVIADNGKVYVNDSENMIWVVSGQSCTGGRVDLARPGDLNRNGRTGMEDFAQLASDWLTCTGSYIFDDEQCSVNYVYPDSDIDRDFYVNMNDLMEIAQWWMIED